MNLVFGIDLILNFFSAYYDADMVIIDDHKVIIIELLFKKILTSNIDHS